MSRKQDKPLPAPPPPQRDPPPPPPPERPPPIPPESRHSWLPSSSSLSSSISSSTGTLSDSQMNHETRCPKDGHLADTHRTVSDHPLQLGLGGGPSHLNGRPLSCPSAGFVRLHHRMDGAGNSESSKVTSVWVCIIMNSARTFMILSEMSWQQLFQTFMVPWGWIGIIASLLVQSKFYVSAPPMFAHVFYCTPFNNTVLLLMDMCVMIITAACMLTNILNKMSLFQKGHCN